MVENTSGIKLEVVRRGFVGGRSFVSLRDEQGQVVTSYRAPERHDHARLLWDAIAAFPKEVT